MLLASSSELRKVCCTRQKGYYFTRAFDLAKLLEIVREFVGSGVSVNRINVGCREKTMPAIEDVGAQDVYRFPGEELAAKYVSVALYGGQFSLGTLMRLLGVNAKLHYVEVFDYLKGRSLVLVDPDGFCTLTESGGQVLWSHRVFVWAGESQKVFISSGHG